MGAGTSLRRHQVRRPQVAERAHGGGVQLLQRRGHRRHAVDADPRGLLRRPVLRVRQVLRDLSGPLSTHMVYSIVAQGAVRCTELPVAYSPYTSTCLQISATYAALASSLDMPLFFSQASHLARSVGENIPGLSVFTSPTLDCLNKPYAFSLSSLLAPFPLFQPFTNASASSNVVGFGMLPGPH